MAPEMFLRKSYDEKVDVFAYGTLLWEILTRSVPFDGVDPGDVRNMVLDQKKLDMPFSLDKKQAELINACRALDPTQRPPFSSIVESLRSFI